MNTYNYGSSVEDLSNLTSERLFLHMVVDHDNEENYEWVDEDLGTNWER